MFRANSAKQIALSPDTRGPPRAEGGRLRRDFYLAIL